MGDFPIGREKSFKSELEIGVICAVGINLRATERVVCSWVSDEVKQ